MSKSKKISTIHLYTQNPTDKEKCKAGNCKAGADPSPSPLRRRCAGDTHVTHQRFARIQKGGPPQI